MTTAGAELSAAGEKVGRYQLVRRVAVGGMAEIYLARLPGVGLEGAGKLVVIKRILPQHALDPELLRMFLDEARLSATLTHPHITEVYDVGTEGDTPFFAMEYVHGSNLRQLMQANARAAGDDNAPLPLALAIGIVAAAAAGLHHAHVKRGPAGEPLHIVHRDVSPSNVLVSYDGAVKVSDFGIAKWAYQRTQTQEGALKGKFAYMSPEQCRGKPLDARSDVFALGVLLYELTTGTPPFAADTDFEILNKIVSGSAEPPRWRDQEYPPALAEIVMRALAREPEARTATAQALQVELETFARAERLEVSTVALGTFMQRLFADELAAWHAAQAAGQSLSDHLAAREAKRPRDEPRTATDAFAATRRSTAAAPARGRRRAIAAAALVGVTITGGLLAASLRKPAHEETHMAAPAPEKITAPVTPTTIVPAPETDVGSTALLARHNVEAVAAPPHVASRSARSSDKGAPRRASHARATPEKPAAPPPSNESRLHAWDPDSPVPP
ncbi:MAG TPA: serine/threonine-protein kinase [Polyangia bacterium]|nr:serine/threonine-protein kinase [Polyangia bacterium]